MSNSAAKTKSSAEAKTRPEEDWRACSGYQRDILETIRRLTTTTRAYGPTGSEIGRLANDIRNDESTSYRKVYDPLNWLVRHDYVQKQKLDERAKEYTLTKKGDRALDAGLNAARNVPLTDELNDEEGGA